MELEMDTCLAVRFNKRLGRLNKVEEVLVLQEELKTAAGRRSHSYTVRGNAREFTEPQQSQEI